MKFKVTIVLRKDKPNKNGDFPIHIRLTYMRKIMYFACGYYIKLENWDKNSSRVIKSMNRWNQLDSIEKVNFQISSEYNRIYRQVDNLILLNPNYNFAQLKNQLKAKKENAKNFYHLAEEIILGYKQKGSIGTFDKCISFLNKLKQYAPNLDLQDITLNFLEKYENYLRDKPKGANGKNTKPNSINTIHSNLKFIRQIVNEAIRRDLLNHSDNPFLKKQLKTEKTEREYLNEDQIKELEEIELTTGSLALTRDMFVFSCYTGGIRISDLLLLRVSDFDSTHLKYKVRKTRDQMHIKLPDKSMSIFKKYSKGKDKESYLFNYIPEHIDESNPELLDKSVAKSTVQYNNNLKKIATKLNWKVNISSHVARHTFATRALGMGMEVYTVSKILGHNSVKQTEVYLRIVNQTLDNAMDKFNK